MARNFSNWIEAYIEHTSITEAPRQFHFWTAVSVIAGALRRRVWIDQLSFQWVPNFYIIFVGPAGVVTKSTTTNIGMQLLRKVPTVHFGPQSMTWQALTKALANSTMPIKYTDMLGEQVKVQMSAITINASELGTFLKPSDQAMIDVLVDLWDGKIDDWTHATATTGETKIPNPWINFLGCTTPAWLRQNFPEHLIGGGLTSRVIFVYGDRKHNYISYPRRLRKPIDYKLRETQLASDLNEIAKLKGEYILTDDAMAWGEDWYVKHWSETPAHMASDRYQPYRARKQAHIHKMAMIFAAATSEQLVIERGHLEAALAIIEGAEPDMIKVFESIGNVQEANHVKEIVAFVRNYKFLTSNQLYSLVRNNMSSRDFDTAVESAVRAKLLKKAERKKGPVKSKGLILGNPEALNANTNEKLNGQNRPAVRSQASVPPQASATDD